MERERKLFYGFLTGHGLTKTFESKVDVLSL